LTAKGIIGLGEWRPESNQDVTAMLADLRGSKAAQESADHAADHAGRTVTTSVIPAATVAIAIAVAGVAIATIAAVVAITTATCIMRVAASAGDPSAHMSAAVGMAGSESVRRDG
jgi:hypothetical protein